MTEKSKSNLSASQLNRTLPVTPRSFQDASIKKVAVTKLDQDASGGAPGLLIEFNQKQSLEAIIQDICEKWNMPDPQQYALRFNEASYKMYITEKNRVDIRDGQVLGLTKSAAETTKLIKMALNGPRLEDKNKALRHLSLLSSDVTFAEEFINMNCLPLVIDIITNGNYKGDPLAYTLKSFVSLMEHNLVAWDILQPEFIKRVADCISATSANKDIVCLQSALAILESVVTYCSDSQSTIEQIVTPEYVILHLESTSGEVQKNAIALINALFTRANESKRAKIAENLQSKSMRNIILQKVIGSTQVGPGMAHELYVLQTQLLNLMEERMRTAVDIHDQNITKEIEELRRIAFDVDGDPNINTVRKSPNAGIDYKKLGFENEKSPIEDFLVTPPGVLALDVMLYFARNHGQNYVKVVLENSTRADEHDCPFVQASKMLTKILCEVLHIGEQACDDGQSFYTMFFTHDKPFEEFFCICIQLFNKTWREMKATAQDFRKVLDVVKEQITRVLDKCPASFETFRQNINTLTYTEINKIWENERIAKEGQGAQLKPIVELRDRLRPEIMTLIQQQRLNFLMGGTRFAKYKGVNRQKDKFWFWRLSPNHKALHYGDCGESDNLTLEQLRNKLPISDIQKLQVGRDCPHMNLKDKGKRTNFNVNWAFSFKLDPDPEADPICFVASSEPEYEMWMDGMNYLLSNHMTSSLVRKDLESLLSMEIKMRMLETEGINIPSEAPAVPDPPVNYNFAYRLP